MKKLNLLKIVPVFFMSLSLIFAACASDSGDGDSKNNSNSSGSEGQGQPSGGGESAQVLGVTLSASTLSLSVNEESTLTVEVTGTNLTDESKKVTWTSSREDVATVADGKITAKSAGTTRITATSVADTSKSAYCDVTVESATTKESTKNEIAVGTSAAAYSFSYTGSGATIYVYSLSGGLNFYGIKVGSATWLVSDLTAGDYSSSTDFTSNGITFTGVISSDSMTIEANKTTIGGTTFTSRFKTGGGGSQTSRCLKISVDSATDFVFYAVSSSGSDRRTMIVEVVENNASTVTIVRPSGISLDKTSASLERTDNEPNPTLVLTATIENASEVTSGYDTITWTSSNTNVATVSNGSVRAVGSGTSTITASTVNGKSAYCNKFHGTKDNFAFGHSCGICKSRNELCH